MLSVTAKDATRLNTGSAKAASAEDARSAKAKGRTVERTGTGWKLLANLRVAASFQPLVTGG
jgi:hypothetical protein